MSLLSSISPNEVTVSPNAAFGVAKSNADIRAASFDYTVRNHLSISSSYSLQEQRNKRDQLYREVTGQDINTLLPSNFNARSAQRTGKNADYYIDQKLAELKESDPELYGDILLTDDLKQDAANAANQSREVFEESMALAGEGTSPTLSAFVGAAPAVIADPVNAASLMVGAGVGASLLKTIAIESAIGAGTEAITQAQVAKWQEELGQEYTTQDMITAVATAGVLSGGLAGVIKGAGIQIARYRQTSVERNPANKVDTKTNKVIETTTPEQQRIHNTNVETYGKMINESKPIVAIETPRVNSEKFIRETVEHEHLWDAATRSGVRIDDAADVERFIQGQYRNDLENELSVLADKAMSRGEVKQLSKEIKSIEQAVSQQVKRLSDDLSKVKSNSSLYIDAARKELDKAPEKQIRKAGKQKQKQAEASIKNEIAKVKQAGDNQKIPIKSKLDNNSKYAAAKSDLSRLKQGIIPPKYKQAFKEAVDAVIGIQKRIDATPKKRIGEIDKNTKYAQNALATNRLDTPPIKDHLPAMQKMNDDAGQQKRLKQVNDYVEANPDQLIPVEGGKVIKASEMDDYLAEMEENATKAVTTCGAV